jgi:hypothetical protein
MDTFIILLLFMLLIMILRMLKVIYLEQSSLSKYIIKTNDDDIYRKYVLNTLRVQ